MRNRIYKWLFLLFLALPFAACQSNDYLYQDISARLRLRSEPVPGRSNLYDTLRFSFLMLDAEITEHIVYFDAHLVGDAAPNDRVFRLEVVEEYTNVPSSAYELGTLVLPAGGFVTSVPVKLKRNVSGMNIADWENNVVARVKFRVVANENFLPHGAENEFTVSWCDYLTKPASWNSSTNIRFGQFSQSRYRFYIYITGNTEITPNDSVGIQLLVAALRLALKEYNDLADVEGRPHWKEDDGSDLVI